MERDYAGYSSLAPFCFCGLERQAWGQWSAAIMREQLKWDRSGKPASRRGVFSQVAQRFNSQTNGHSSCAFATAPMRHRTKFDDPRIRFPKSNRKVTLPFDNLRIADRRAGNVPRSLL